MHGNPRRAWHRGQVGGLVTDATSEGQPLAPVPPEEGQEQLGQLGFPVEVHLAPAWVTGSSLSPSFSIPQNTFYQEVQRCVLHFPAPRKKRSPLCLSFVEI